MIVTALAVDAASASVAVTVTDADAGTIRQARVNAVHACGITAGRP